MDSVVRKAYAKVNLGLDIVGLREDGYHLVRMIMQTIGINDVLTFRKVEEPGVVLKISEKSTLTDIADVPMDDRNLVVRAAKKILEKISENDRTDCAAVIPGVEITLEKHIPMAAGMAGGSTDCAAALRGVAELFGYSCSEEELAEIGVSLGADVPYCLMGGTALSEGIGEKLTKLPDLPPCRFVIIKPEFGASTKEVYGTYDALNPEEIDHPDIDGMVDSLNRGDLSGVLTRLGNVLELVTARLHPEITQIEDMLKELGVTDTIMTGSGPTVFGVLKKELNEEERNEEERNEEERNEEERNEERRNEERRNEERRNEERRNEERRNEERRNEERRNEERRNEERRNEERRNEDRLKAALTGKLEKAGIPARVYVVDGTVKQ